MPSRNFSQKTNKQIYLFFLCWRPGSTWNLIFHFKFQVFPDCKDIKTNSFVCFLGEVVGQQFCFTVVLRHTDLYNKLQLRCHQSKNKSCSEQFLWIRNWDLGWLAILIKNWANYVHLLMAVFFMFSWEFFLEILYHPH